MRRSLSLSRLDAGEETVVKNASNNKTKNKSLPCLLPEPDALTSVIFDQSSGSTSLVPASFSRQDATVPFLTISDGLHRDNFSAVVVGNDDDDLRHNLLSIDLYEDFGIYHRCLQRDDDPFVGLVRDSSAKCCAMRAFLDLAHGSFDEGLRSLYKPSFNAGLTAYGEQLQRINALVYEIDIRILLHDHWKLKGNLLGPEPLYEFISELIPTHVDDDRVEWLFGPCSVCLASCRYIRRPPCCHASICQPCWASYVRNYAKTSISLHLNGIYNLRCFSCKALVPYSQALLCTNPSDMQLIRPHLGRPTSVARCPNCLKVPKINKSQNVTQKGDESDVILEASKKSQQKRRQKGGQPVTCDRCGHVFCAFCGTNDHPKLSCQELTGSDIGLRKWTREKSVARPDFPNGRFCPSCNIPVSHSGGCPQMVCPCGAEFCYSCGRKYCRSLPYLLPGHKSSRFVPIISCPKLWKSQPKRIAVHTIITLGIVVGVGPLALAVSPLVIPAAIGYYLIERSRRRRH